MKLIKVLIVDDSILFREMLQQELEKITGIKVVGKAADPFEASRLINELAPDVLLVDIFMDKMTGIEFVKKLLPQYYLPVIMMSSDGSMKLEAESIEDSIVFFEKPKESLLQKTDLFFKALAVQIKSFAYVEQKSYTIKEIKKLSSSIIAIGASTGGSEAIETVLKNLPAVTSPIVISQHMPPKFTKNFAERLNSICKVSVKEAADGEIIYPGQAYIAPGGFHMSVKRKDLNTFTVNCTENVDKNPICPNINVMFESIADIKTAGDMNATGVILTGMGRDGAAGLKKMREAGCRTIGQDESTSVIYGMPKAAYEIGAVELQLKLDKIPRRIADLM